MKKCIGCLGILLIVFSGCSSKKPQVDYMTSCSLTSDNGDATLNMSVKMGYVLETGQLVTREVTTKYEGLEKTTTSSLIKTDLLNQKAAYEELDGINVVLNLGTTALEYIENWDYTKVDVEKVLAADENQKQFVKDEAFSKDAYEAYYKKQGFSCRSAKP